MSGSEKEISAPKVSGRDFNVVLSPDDLPDHLKKYVITEHSLGMHFFKHPLFVSMMPLITPLPLDEFLAKREGFLDSYLKDFGPKFYLGCHERPFRSGRLLEMVEEGYWNEAYRTPRKACEFWQCAAYVWTDCEEDEGDDIWERILECDIPHREFMTTSAERKALKALGDHLTVYRGVQGPNEEEAFKDGVMGYQWTLDRETAVFFSSRLIRDPDQGYLMTTSVRRSDVIAHFTNRGESEIVIAPDDLDWDNIEINRVLPPEVCSMKAKRQKQSYI